MPTKLRREADKEATGPRLDDIIDHQHALTRLNQAIDWRLLEGRLGGSGSAAGQGRPSQSRLIVGLAILRQLHDLGEDALFDRWLESP